MRDMRYYTLWGGNYYSSERALTLPAEPYPSTTPILRWKGSPAFIYATIIGVTMPTADAPWVGYVLSIDKRAPEMYDWTIEEYNTHLGFTPNYGVVSHYGGCTIYNTGTKKYASITLVEFPVNDAFGLDLVNWTGLDVNVDLFEVQWYSYGDPNNITYSKFPYGV